MGFGERRVQALEELLEGLEDGICNINACEFIDHVCGVFGLPPETIKEHLYLFLQVQRESPFQQKVTGDRGRQERGVDHGVYQIERGDGGSGDSNPVRG